MITLNTNLSSLIAQTSLKSSTQLLNQAVERMTTGYKINHAKDNAANYSIATDMSTKLSAYDIASDNVAMGMDLVTTANDIISNMQDLGSRLHALSTQARNGTYGAQSLDAINSEATAIMAEINRLYSTAEYNGIKLFASSEASAPIMFAAPRAGGTTEKLFIEDPITYTDEEVEAMTTMTEAVANDSFVVGGTYSISTVDELVALADYFNNRSSFSSDMTFVLGADIDLSSISNWTPIGNNRFFTGTFDGNGHVIKNLTIDNETTDNQGLFYFIVNAEIKNVGLEGGSVKGNNYVGGLVAYSKTSSVSNSYTTVIVNGSEQVGGLVGYSTASSSVSNCYSTGMVDGYYNVGGLVGFLNDSSVSNCYATSTVSGDYNVGGLVGVSGTSSISNSYATGTVNGSSSVGGLVGAHNNSSSVSNCYATSTVSGSSSVGGLVGSLNNSSVSNCYATGTVNGSYNRIGGLVGNSSGTVSNSYATGIVTGTAATNSVTNSADWDGTNFTYDYGVASVPGNTTPTPEGGSSSGGSYGVSAFNLQVGINGDSSNQISFDTNFDFDLSAVEADISSDSALASINEFIALLSDKATTLGAVSNRLESALESISVNIENLTSSRSTIRDADIAEVSSEYIRQQILQQASATLLSTANQSPSIALQLI